MQPSAAHFSAPPPAARPWVYSMWLSSNLTPASITADLEAMQPAGLGGALSMDVDQGTHAGPVGFASDGWYALVDHAVAEAARLGMQLTINNGPGYSGSGGPWVPRDQAIQRVFWSETRITGGQRWSGTLPKGKAEPEYRDIAVLAVAEPAPAEPTPAGPPAKRWHPHCRLDITTALRPGRKDVAVTVVTTWVNRLIANARLAGRGRTTAGATGDLLLVEPVAAGRGLQAGRPHRAGPPGAGRYRRRHQPMMRRDGDSREVLRFLSHLKP